MTSPPRTALEPAIFRLSAASNIRSSGVTSVVDDAARSLIGASLPIADDAGLGTLLRQPADGGVLRVGPLELDLMERAAKRGERGIELLPREFRLLEYMMRHKEQVLTRAALLKDVWNYKFTPNTNLIDVHMGRLRRKVDKPNELPMIYNIRGAGFILRAPAQG